MLSSKLQLVGFTVGNDMSSRDIEGDNPLYLPQAKCYNQSCGLGPWITLPVGMPPRSEIGIRLVDSSRRQDASIDGRTERRSDGPHVREPHRLARAATIRFPPARSCSPARASSPKAQFTLEAQATSSKSRSTASEHC